MSYFEPSVFPVSTKITTKDWQVKRELGRNSGKTAGGKTWAEKSRSMKTGLKDDSKDAA
jgi:hypothetical protein